MRCERGGGLRKWGVGGGGGGGPREEVQYLRKWGVWGRVGA